MADRVSLTLRGAAAMATAAYTFTAEPFLRAGWQDACVQLGPAVACGLNPDVDEGVRADFRALRQALAQGKTLRRTVVSGVQQWRSASGVKSMSLLRPLADGRILCAVIFTGSVQFDDWMANFDMVSENGMHRGFLRRAAAFEEMEEAICFPRAAAQLGVDRLTLRDILEHCAAPDSPFLLAVTGHSLGAAVMQVYLHRLVTERGVRMDRVQGVGFASPSVAAAGAVADPAAWPIRHVFNSDDVIPRTGAQVHLGQCVTFPADTALRMQCYHSPDDEAAIEARRLMQPIYDGLTDTGACLCGSIALLELLADLPPAQVVPFLGRVENRWAPLRLIVDAGDSQADRFNRYLQRRAVSYHRSIYGQGPDTARIARFYQQLREAVDRIGLSPALNGLAQLASAAHSMSAVYTRIAERLEGSP